MDMTMVESWRLSHSRYFVISPKILEVECAWQGLFTLNWSKVNGWKELCMAGIGDPLPFDYADKG